MIIAGCGDTVNVAYNYGFKKALHIHEYSSLFPYLSPLSNKYREKETVDKYFNQIKDRFGDSFNIQEVQEKGESSIPIKA